MDVSNPRRILAVSLEGATQHLSRVIKDLTGSAPEPPASPSASLAGTTHELSLNTAYYTASVPVWLDLVASPADWAASFLSDEAREVLAVLGGLVLVFALPAGDDARQLIRHVARVVKDGLGGWEWDGVGLAVGVGDVSDVEEWDELCAEAGLEFVQLGGRQPQRNEFGEKTGIARVREALESNDWAQLDEPALSDFGDFEDPDSDAKSDGKDELDPESLDFGFDRADFEGLKKAIWSSGRDDPDDTAAEDANMLVGTSKVASKAGDAGTSARDRSTGGENAATAPGGADEAPGDEDVANVEKMMQQLLAVREAGEGMAPDQRRRMAARAVEQVMKDM